MSHFSLCILWSMIALTISSAQAERRHESFDQEPAGWVGVNNRNQHFEPRTVTQDFGYSPRTRHAGGAMGEVGGRIQPAGESAYYGFRLPRPLSLEEPFSAGGKFLLSAGGGNLLLGFFNTNSLNEWRTPHSLAIRLNGRGETFHAHVEYATRLWRAGAGVIGDIVPGERITPLNLPSDRDYAWRLVYDPKGGEGESGEIGFTLNGQTARCAILPEHRRDGAVFTHFGLLPVLKTWDGPGEVWLDDLSVNGETFDFARDPQWEASGNRRSYPTTDTRPRFDFGWSPTHYAGGQKAGELGGLIFRGDCREPERMACYGDRLEPLSLATRLHASGKVAMRRGVTDSTASIGFYHSRWSMQSNPSQKQSVPMDYLGINIEGPSTEGFYFYPVYRGHGDAAKAWSRGEGGEGLRIYPDGIVHEWFLDFDPEGANGRGRITVRLGGRTCVLDLEEGHRAIGAQFDRFGICTPWIDGNSVTVYFDDLEYTCSAEP